MEVTKTNMGTARYLLPNKILYVSFNGHLSLDDLCRAGKHAISLAQRSPTPPVHFIIDETNLEDVPRHLPSLIKTTDWLGHPKIGVVILYGAQSQLIRFVTATIAQFAGAQFRLATEFDEAIAYLQVLDETLPDLSALTPETVQDT